MQITFENIVAILSIIGVVWGATQSYLYLTLKDKWKKDIEESLRNTCSEEKCKLRISSQVDARFDAKFESIGKDLTSLKESLIELKTLVKNQQELLVAIQIDISRIGPRVDNLEKRLDKVEKKLDL